MLTSVVASHVATGSKVGSVERLAFARVVDEHDGKPALSLRSGLAGAGGARQNQK